MAWIRYILSVFGVLNFVLSVTDFKGRCTCNAFRCETDRVISGSCYSASLPGGWGLKCCKPYCLCKSYCEGEENDEGRYDVQTSVDDVIKKDLGLDSNIRDCPENQTFCCPKCKCTRGMCDVKETSTHVKSCGENMKLCCQPQATLYRPWYGCTDKELPLDTGDTDHICGICQCKRSCETFEAHMKQNTCGTDRNLCCKLCGCKSECGQNEVNIGRGKCGYRQQQCCRACTCKAHCNTPEELLGPEGCFYGETVCCKT